MQVFATRAQLSFMSRHMPNLGNSTRLMGVHFFLSELDVAGYIFYKKCSYRDIPHNYYLKAYRICSNLTSTFPA